MPATNGAFQLSSTGALILNASGEAPLTAPTVKPCCCPSTSCPAHPAQTPCTNTSYICCCDVDAEPSFTFPTITPATGIAGETYGATASAAITALSGQTVTLVNYSSDTGCTYVLQGTTVTDINCCTVYTWRVILTINSGGSSGYMGYQMSLDVISSTNGGPLAVGDAFPCDVPTATTLPLARMSAVEDGDCCGGDGVGGTINLVMDLIDSDYIDDASLTVLSNGFGVACTACNRNDTGAYPASVTLDLGDFVAVLAGQTVTFTPVSYPGVVGIDTSFGQLYATPSSGLITIGSYRYAYGSGSIVQNASCNDLPDGNKCCQSVAFPGSGNALTVEFFDGMTWVPYYNVAASTFAKALHTSIPGTYALQGSTPFAPASITLT